MKKKHGACRTWQWKETEQVEWKEDNTAGKICIFTFMSFCELSKLSSDIQVGLTQKQAVKPYSSMFNLL